MNAVARTAIVNVQAKTALATPRAPTTVVSTSKPVHVLVTRGIPGPMGDTKGALLTKNRLSEFASDPTAQADAQANLGLGSVDPLAYYILAKA